MSPRPVHIGCSGWNYADWRGAVYPPGCPPRRWLAHYATLFATVEVNSTFYRLARPEAVAEAGDERFADDLAQRAARVDVRHEQPRRVGSHVDDGGPHSGA